MESPTLVNVITRKSGRCTYTMCVWFCCMLSPSESRKPIRAALQRPCRFIASQNRPFLWHASGIYPVKEQLANDRRERIKEKERMVPLISIKHLVPITSPSVIYHVLLIFYVNIHIHSVCAPCLYIFYSTRKLFSASLKSKLND